MKNVLINIVVGIICLMSGAVTAKHIFNVLKLIPVSVWIGLGVCGFIALVIFFLYKCFTLFPDVFTDDQETEKGGFNK